MSVSAPAPLPDKSDSLLEAFCSRCARKTYVRRGSELSCPVCSTPLTLLSPAEQS